MPTLKAPATLLLSRQLRLLLPAIFLCCLIPLYSGQQFSSSDSAEEDRLLHPANVEENGQQQREVALAESSDEPKLSALSRRREWLIRTLQQREEQRKNAALIVQPARVLRPYGQSVPKAQSMPGPILLSALKDEKPQLRRVEVNVQSTAGLLRAKAAEDGQKQRQQQPRRLHLVNGGADGNAEGEEEAEAEMADEKAANREMEEEEEEAEAQAQAELELISNEVQQKRHPSGRVDSAKPTSKYRAEPQQQFAFSLDSEPEQQQQQKKRGPLPSPAKSFGQTQLQKWAQQPIAVARAGQQSPRTKVGPATAGHRQSQQPIRLGKQQQQPLPQRQPQPSLSLPPSQIQSQQQQQPQKLHFIYSQSQTVVNEDFAIVPNSPGLACLYGMPVPVYNTPRKQCIPHSPLCGIAFTCVMDVQAVDDRGQPVPNWWLISGAQQQQQQSGASGIGQPSAEWTTAGGGGGQQTQPQQQQNYLSTAGQGFSQGQSGFGQASPTQEFGQTTSQSHGFGQASQGQGFGGLGHGLLLDPNFGLGHGLGGGSQSLLQSQGLFG